MVKLMVKRHTYLLSDDNAIIWCAWLASNDKWKYVTMIQNCKSYYQVSEESRLIVSSKLYTLWNNEVCMFYYSIIDADQKIDTTNHKCVYR